MTTNRSLSDSNDEKLAGIIFISIPDSLSLDVTDISLDPERLLPVETGGQPDAWDLTELSWEMIISGMLKILAYRPEHEDAEYYRRFIAAVKPDLHRELTEAAIIKTRNHEHDLAEEIFRALVGLEPGNCRSVLNLALILEERASIYGKLENQELQEHYEDDAFNWYKRALSLDDVVPDAHLYAGYFYLKQHSYDLARSSLAAYMDDGTDEEQKKRIKLIISDIDTQNLKDTLFKEAFDFIRMEKEEEGIAKIRLFLEKNPKVWNAWFILGWGLRRLKRYEHARDAFLEAIKHGGSNSDTYNELAICHMEVGDFVASRATLEQALSIEPENIKIMSNLGILALKQELPVDAIGFFRTVLEYAPDDAIAQKYIEHLENR